MALPECGGWRPWEVARLTVRELAGVQDLVREVLRGE